VYNNNNDYYYCYTVGCGMWVSYQDRKPPIFGETDPLGRTTTTTYREDGLIAAITDGNGSTTSFEYDLAGNQTASNSV
jgi:YD repeat-containing protein